MPWRLGSGRPRGQPSSPIRRGTTRVRGWKGEAVDEVDEDREARSGGRLRGERGGRGSAEAVGPIAPGRTRGIRRQSVFFPGK